MPEQRLRKAQRILKVQEQLHRMAEWRLGELERQKYELEETRAALINTLNGDDVLHGLFVEATAKRLQSLAVQADEVERRKVAQAKVTVDRAMQVKRTERMIGVLSVEDRRAEEKRDYLSLLDVIATKPDASLP